MGINSTTFFSPSSSLRAPVQRSPVTWCQYGVHHPLGSSSRRCHASGVVRLGCARYRPSPLRTDDGSLHIGRSANIMVFCFLSDEVAIKFNRGSIDPLRGASAPARDEFEAPFTLVRPALAAALPGFSPCGLVRLRATLGLAPLATCWTSFGSIPRSGRGGERSRRYRDSRPSLRDVHRS